MKKAPRSELTQAEIRKFFREGVPDTGDLTSELVCLAVRAIVEETHDEARAQSPGARRG